MPTKMPGPNQLCWCQSGLRFKRCHRNRQEQTPEHPRVTVDALRKAFQVKKCSAEGKGLGPCSGPIIHAHTVSRGANLSKIARVGKVTTYGGGYDALKRNNGRLTPTEIGIKQASTFNGFCAGHDSTLFTCIENDAFAGRPDQCLAIAFRALSRELYAKDAAASVRNTLRNADKGKPFVQQVAVQQRLALLGDGNDLARRELKVSHDKVTRTLANGQFDALRSLVIECDGHLPFMVAAAWSPINDLWGKEIQPPWNNVLLEQIFLSTFSGRDTSYIVLSWLAREQAPGQTIANQLTALSPTEMITAILQFAVKHAENIFFSPTWFDALSRLQKKFLDTLAEDGRDELGKTPSVPIRPNIDYALPKARQVFYAGPEFQSPEKLLPRVAD